MGGSGYGLDQPHSHHHRGHPHQAQLAVPARSLR